jgi:UDP-N-acetylmuramate--alanine ligase
VSGRTYAHFIGIGGAGMSGIARVLHDRGLSVSGSDLRDSRYSHALSEAGIPVAIGHDASNLGDPEVVVVSSAIPDSNPELAEARRRDLPVWPRAKMLARLAEDRSTIAIAGTHGKTTTSSMVATMLTGMGLDPTYLIGGEVCEFGTNAACGDGVHYVVEADESDGSFLYLDPTVSVITNVEADHLDHYGTLAAVEETFERFAARTVSGGTVVVCADDARALTITRSSGARIVTYGCAEGADVRCTEFQAHGEGHSFKVTLPDGGSCKASVAVPGTHNVLNATASLAVAYALGLDVRSAADALAGFAGVKRRFDLIGEAGGVRVIDDYAHHPTEVRATLAAARTAGAKRVWVIFQPHRYSRTAALAAEFGAAFAEADRVILMEIYSAGETPIPGVTGKMLVEELLLTDPRARVSYLPHRSDIPAYLSTFSREGDLVITMGAGDVTALGPEILHALTGEVEAACL